jgi:type IV pilus assembly protein PilX
MKSIPLIAPLSRQRGVTLIVALIFLAILMLLGVTIAQTSSMEERMAGNTRDRDLALQSAESALTAADSAMKALPRVPNTDPDPNKRGKITTAFDGSTVGYVAYDPAHASDAAYWNAYDWAGASHSAGTSLSGVAAQPRYVIEKLPDSVNTQRFRVTARGVGSSASTVVILQAGYENN